MNIRSLVVNAVALACAVATVQARAQIAHWMHLPYLPDGQWETFVRMPGSNVAATQVTIDLFSDDGSYAGRIESTTPRNGVSSFNSRQLRDGGIRAGPWSARIVWSAGLFSGNAARPAIFLRSNGFVSALHDTGEIIPNSALAPFPGINYGERHYTLNPGRNTSQVGWLFVSALGRATEIIVTLVNDAGDGGGAVEFRLDSWQTLRITSQRLEAVIRSRGEVLGSRFQFGKWRVVILGTRGFTSQTGIHSRPVGIYANTSSRAQAFRWYSSNVGQHHPGIDAMRAMSKQAGIPRAGAATGERQSLMPEWMAREVQERLRQAETARGQ